MFVPHERQTAGVAAEEVLLWLEQSLAVVRRQHCSSTGHSTGPGQAAAVGQRGIRDTAVVMDMGLAERRSRRVEAAVDTVSLFAVSEQSPGSAGGNVQPAGACWFMMKQYRGSEANAGGLLVTDTGAVRWVLRTREVETAKPC